MFREWEKRGVDIRLLYTHNVSGQQKPDRANPHFAMVETTKMSLHKVPHSAMFHHFHGFGHNSDRDQYLQINSLKF